MIGVVTLAFLVAGQNGDVAASNDAAIIAAPTTIGAPAPTPPGTPAGGEIDWTAGTLVFQTGFEGTTAIAEPLANGNQRIIGRDDRLPKSDFGADINALGANAPINYTGGTPAQRQAIIASDPADPKNRTLRFILREPYAASEEQTKARVQMDLYGFRPGLREFRQSVRAYLHPDFRKLESYPSRIGWLTLAEYWNNEWWVQDEPYGFRITLGIGKPTSDTEELNLFVEAQDAGQVEVWHHDNRTAKVPIGQWFTLETYYREGDRGTGRFVLAITPDGGPRRILYDVTDFTHNTRDPAPNGLTGYNPVKLYTSAGVVNHVRSNGGVLAIDWDDLKIWRVR